MNGLFLLFIDLLLLLLLLLWRYSTVTKETGSSTKKIFYAMFFNTALITLIINARIYDFIPSLEISKIIPALHDYMEE